MTDSTDQERRRITCELPVGLIEKLAVLKKEWGLRNRSDLIQRLLEMVLPGGDQSGGEEQEDEEEARHQPFDEKGALVLLERTSQTELEVSFESLGFDPQDDPGDHGTMGTREGAASGSGSGSGGGIDLPGFVRRQSAQVKRSLDPARPASTPREPLPLVSSQDLSAALGAAEEHWLDVYGQPANATVLEAAMVWIAQDIWRQSDLSDGRPFSWSLVEQVIQGFAPSWQAQPPSFARVIVAAGLLEDPFSSGTLALRLPTLIRRFVHRFRRRPRGTSFQTLENTMTLHGALKLLQLPTTAGHRFALAEIREAYREQAVSHHPDSGGSVEAMRRLNEAYQLLKELYRQSA